MTKEPKSIMNKIQNAVGIVEKEETSENKSKRSRLRCKATKPQEQQTKSENNTKMQTS